MRPLLLLLPLLFLVVPGCAVEAFAPADWTVEEGEGAKLVPVTPAKPKPHVTPIQAVVDHADNADPGPVNADGQVAMGPFPFIQSRVCGPDGCSSAEAPGESAGPVRRVWQGRPRVVGRVFSRCGLRGCR